MQKSFTAGTEADPEDFDSVLQECAAFAEQLSSELWEASPIEDEPIHLFEKDDLTDEEYAELDAWIAESDARYSAI